MSPRRLVEDGKPLKGLARQGLRTDGESILASSFQRMDYRRGLFSHSIEENPSFFSCFFSSVHDAEKKRAPF